MTAQIVPDVLIAVHAHFLAHAAAAMRAAQAEQTRAELAALADGVPLAAITTAMQFVASDPATMEREEHELDTVLQAIGAPIQFDQVQVIERRTDESAASRFARLERHGYFAAINGRPNDGGGLSGSDREAWSGGWLRFRADLQAYRHSRRPARREVAA